MIRKCFDLVTLRLGSSQITGIRSRPRGSSLFSGSKSFGIASGDDDLRTLGAQEVWAVARPMPVVPPVIRMVLEFMDLDRLFRSYELADYLSSPC